jgi:hypothetical protein
MRSYSRSICAAVGAVTLASAMMACDNRILRVTAPDVVAVGALQSAAALPTITASVYAQFGVAYAGDGGDHEGIIEDSGLLGDEFKSSDTFPTRNQIDERLILTDNGEVELDMRYLQEARAFSEAAVRAYQKFQPGAALEAEALSYAGLSYLLVGENWCTGIPFSTLQPNGGITYGKLESTAEIEHDARVRFDSALAILKADTAAADAGILAQEIALASVGKGRALVDSGDYADAATAVAGVPDAFVQLQGYAETPTRVQNGVFEYTYNEGRYSIADQKGGTGIPYITAHDPRVNVVDSHSKGFDGVVELFLPLADTTRHTPIPIATGVEARLIQAEAALAAGDMAGFFSNINKARAQFPGVSPVSAIPAGMDALHFLFQERAFDLWLTGHRLGDMRRLVRQYAQNVNTVFPQGSTEKGVAYGTAVSLPLPIAELGNPNYAQCNTATP